MRRIALETIRGFRADRGPDLAASLSFATLLMAVPLAATFSILLAAFFQQNDKAILDVINSVLPYQTARLTANLNQFIATASTVSGIGLLIVLGTSLRLIFLIENTVNIVWGAPKRTRFLARVAVYTLGVFVGALLLGVLLTGFQELRRQAMFQNLSISALFGRFVATLVVGAALTLLYKFLPNARVSWRAAAAGGVSAALLLRAIKLGFALYFSLFHGINIIYGSLSLILLVLTSLFFFWAVVLGGVELACVVDASASPSASQMGAGRAERAVRLLLSLSERSEPARLEDVQRDAAGVPAEIEELVGQLAAANLISGDRARGYALTLKPAGIRLSQVVSAVSPDLLSVTRDGGDRVARVLRMRFRKFANEQRALLDLTLSDVAGKRG